MHFVLNIPGYQEALSVKSLTESTALSTKTYYKAVSELIEKQYLVKEPNKFFSEYYAFYENPNLSVSQIANTQSTPEGEPSSDSSSDEI